MDHPLAPPDVVDAAFAAATSQHTAPADRLGAAQAALGSLPLASLAAALAADPVPPRRFAAAVLATVDAITSRTVKGAHRWPVEEVPIAASALLDALAATRTDMAATGALAMLDRCGRSPRFAVDDAVHLRDRLAFCAAECGVADLNSDYRRPPARGASVLAGVMRAPLTERSAARISQRRALIAGWVALSGGEAALAEMLRGKPAERGVALCGFAVCSTNTDGAAGRSAVIVALADQNVTEAMRVAAEVTGITER